MSKRTERMKKIFQHYAGSGREIVSSIGVGLLGILSGICWLFILPFLPFYILIETGEWYEVRKLKRFINNFRTDLYDIKTSVSDDFISRRFDNPKTIAKLKALRDKKMLK